MHMNKEQTAADLRGAAAYIEAHGWLKGDLQEGSTGRVCLMGGILGGLGLLDHDGHTCDDYERGVALDDRREAAEKTALGFLEHVRAQLPTDEFGDNPEGLEKIAWWNDHQAQSATEVTQMLEKAAAWVEEQA